MIMTLLRFVITSGARDLLFAFSSEKQIPRAQKPGARNDNSARRLVLSRSQ
jgi:hypothetical protein